MFYPIIVRPFIATLEIVFFFFNFSDFFDRHKDQIVRHKISKQRTGFYIYLFNQYNIPKYKH